MTSEGVVMRGLLVIPHILVMGLVQLYCMCGSSSSCGFEVWAVVWD